MLLPDQPKLRVAYDDQDMHHRLQRVRRVHPIRFSRIPNADFIFDKPSADKRGGKDIHSNLRGPAHARLPCTVLRLESSDVPKE